MKTTIEPIKKLINLRELHHFLIDKRKNKNQEPKKPTVKLSDFVSVFPRSKDTRVTKEGKTIYRGSIAMLTGGEEIIKWANNIEDVLVVEVAENENEN